MITFPNSLFSNIDLKLCDGYLKWWEAARQWTECYLSVTKVLPAFYMSVNWVLPDCYLIVTWVLPECYLKCWEAARQWTEAWGSCQCFPWDWDQPQLDWVAPTFKSSPSNNYLCQWICCNSSAALQIIKSPICFKVICFCHLILHFPLIPPSKTWY